MSEKVRNKKAGRRNAPGHVTAAGTSAADKNASTDQLVDVFCKLVEQIKQSPFGDQLTKASQYRIRSERLESLLVEAAGIDWEETLLKTDYGQVVCHAELLEELDRAGKLKSPIHVSDLLRRARRINSEYEEGLQAGRAFPLNDGEGPLSLDVVRALKAVRLSSQTQDCAANYFDQEKIAALEQKPPAWRVGYFFGHLGPQKEGRAYVDCLTLQQVDAFFGASKDCTHGVVRSLKEQVAYLNAAPQFRKKQRAKLRSIAKKTKDSREKLKSA